MKKNNQADIIVELARQLAFIDFLSDCYDRVYGIRLERLKRKYEKKYEKALKKARRKNEKKNKRGFYKHTKRL